MVTSSPKNKGTIKKKDQTTTMKIYDMNKPDQVVAMANELKEYVVKNKLYTNIKGKNYAHVDGWQFAGFLSGLNAVVLNVKDLSTEKERKWFAMVAVYNRDEKPVSNGFAVCSNKESKKEGFDEYAILSMAQTRAIGKAYRNKIGWVMKLAGYESTPSEEADESIISGNSKVLVELEKMLQKVEAPDALEKLKQKMIKSEKYNSQEKIEIQDMIDQRIAEINQQKNDNA